MSLWADRDLPVLRFLHDHPPHDGMLETNRLSEKPHSDLPQLTEQDVHIAVQTLHDVGYVDFENQEGESSGGVLWQDILVTGAGKQILGEWPLFEALGSPAELAAILDRLADMAATDEEKSNLRKAASSARERGVDGLKTLAAGVLRAYVRSQILGA
jgi:hypothetical protein